MGFIANMTAEEVRDILSYKPETGVFHWRVAHGIHKSIPESSVAGCVNSKGYIQVTIGKTKIKAHRLAWIYVYGEWPKGILDHIDRDKTNNRISNLRMATNRQNSTNSKVFSTNTSGHRNVSWEKDRKRWLVSVHGNNGKMVKIGRFTDLSDAAMAAEDARRCLYGEFSA